MTIKLKRATVRQSLEFLSGAQLLAAEDGNDVLPVLAAMTPPGTIYCVDSVNGVDTNPGTSWAAPLLTIQAAVDLAVAGDIILIQGSFTEAVTVATAGVSLIGVGVTPKDACIWTAAADADCLSITAEHVLVQNIYFRPPAYSSDRTTCAIKISGANYLRVRGCRFQGKTGSQAAIYSAVANSDNVEISDCEFMYMNTATYGAGIRGVNAGGVQYSGWKILNNVFAGCVTAIMLSCRMATIVGNTIAEYGVNPAGAVAQLLALGIDLSGDDATNSGANCVWGNQLGGTYGATLYKVGNSGDQWGGNYNVISGGLTAANPS
jgi:hypothetical protein